MLSFLKRVRQRDTKPNKRRQPNRLELLVLESRDCPSVSATVIDGHILQVDGDSTSNAIDVVCRGSQVTVAGDGAPAQNFRGIDQVHVRTGAGDDMVRLMCEPTEVPAEMGQAFHFDLGVGNDALRAFIGQSEMPMSAAPSRLGYALTLDCDGNAGTDSLAADVMNVQLDAPVALTLTGAEGSDRIVNTWTGVVLNAPTVVNTYGGMDGDDIRVIFGFNPQPDPPATPLVVVNAPLAVNVDGGMDGDDIRVIFGFNPQPDPPATPLVVVNAPVAMNVGGGLGGDNIAVICGFNPQPDPPAFPVLLVNSSMQVTALGDNGDDMMAGVFLPTVQRTGSFRALFDGGNGNDMETAIFLPAVQRGGSVDASFLGGRGNDMIDVFVDLGRFTPESGHVAVNVNGGAGNDILTFLVRGPEQPLENAMFQLDGGGGDDFALVSADVQVTHARKHIGGVK